jgi:hypothetical protein
MSVRRAQWRTRGVAFAAVMVLASGCKKAARETTSSSGPPSATAPAASPAVLAERTVSTMEELAAAHEQPGDCAALAARLRDFRATHGDVLGASSRAAYQAIEADARLAARMKAAMTRVMTRGMACRDDPGFGEFRRSLTETAK